MYEVYHFPFRLCHNLWIHTISEYFNTAYFKIQPIILKHFSFNIQEPRNNNTVRKYVILS
ncbi:HN1_G0050480.mRNA.1.CDS.1 [Saccharomyces cerevisiae]|nr:HN1_G0050480.mRNA.1.CDS.1 [Saccharomyces cerevisiae]CAI4426728.1 BAL_1a_G0017120.mRNA.1.CDS.1 [Saccharomyces cerevisiae]CAI7110219.1 BAL_1a_G0017120.mRNA.1.CDS.1 [Saccharomyces cerevisiae]